LAEQQCGHGILHLPSSEGLLYPNHPPAGKLARNLTEPVTKRSALSFSNRMTIGNYNIVLGA
jgi:hypothetical protein